MFFLLNDMRFCNVSVRAEIAALQAEQEEILKNMRLIESQANQEKDNKNCENLGELGRTKRENLLSYSNMKLTS